MPQPKAKQLNWSSEDLAELGRRIELDWTQDSLDLEPRNNAYRRWIRLWRAARDTNSVPEQEASNFHIPLTQWQVLAKLAKEMDALLGEESEVITRPVGPTDAVLAPKIARYMTWRIKTSLKLFKKLYDYLLQKTVLGTSIGFIPWITRERIVRKKVIDRTPVTKTVTDPTTGLIGTVPDMEETEREVEDTVLDYDGPDLVVESIENWAFPAYTKSLDDVDHFERRLRLTVDELLDMADDGKLDSKVFDEGTVSKLRQLADTGKVAATESDAGKQVRDEKRAQEGLPAEGAEQGRDGRLTIINWFGKYRRKSAKPKDRAGEIVAYWQPETKMLLGTSRLVDLFPDGRRPFILSQLVRDVDSIWGIGLPEFLESINREMDVQHNALTDASVYALGPLIVYEPVSGFNPQSFRYEPFTAIAVADANRVKALPLGAVNLAPYVTLQPQLLGYAERVSGITESELGRPFSQPNAPRTLGQQQIIQAGSGVRLLLDLRLERENLRELLHRVWELDKRFAPKPLRFRVSESSEIEELTGEEMMGDYDFELGPVTSTANKSQEIAMLLQAYALNLQNPLAAQNPALMAGFIKKLNSKLGQDELNTLIPDMEEMRPPESPEQENVKLLAGQDVDPHPADNHVRHIAVHQDLRSRVEMWEQQNPGFFSNIGRSNILAGIDAHIAEHQQAQKTGAVGISPMAGQGGNQNMGMQPTDGSGQFGEPMNLMKSLLNQGGLNLG